MIKGKSNVFSKGQGGANFEFRVQSAFLIYMLVKANIPCLPAGKISLIRLQSSSPQYGFNTDDLYLEFISEEENKHKLLVQIKHNLSFSEKNKNFQEVIDAAWSDFNSDKFNSRTDKIMVVKGNLSDREYNHLLAILDWAKFKKSAGDFFDEVNAIEAKKKYLNTFRKSLEKSNQGEELPPQQLWSFLKCFCIVSYDFNNESSKDLAQLQTVIQLSIPDNSKHTAKAVWNSVLEFISKADSKGGSFSLETLPSDLKEYFVSTEKINLFVHHKDSPPLSFDYFFLDGQLNKSFTEQECRFKILIENKMPSSFIIDKILLKTIRYEKVLSRILRLYSVQGLFVPEEFSFIPSKVVGKSVEMLKDGQSYRVEPNEDEVIIFELDDKSVSPGYYELMIILKGHCGNKEVQLKSKVIPLSISSKSNNRLTLETMKFFETPIEAVLELEEKKWRKLQKEMVKDKYALYLGQTILENPEDIPNGSDWKIKGLKKKQVNKDGYTLPSDGNSKVFVNLGIPIKEDLFDLTLEQKSIIEFVGKDKK